MLMESQVKFLSPHNISASTKQPKESIRGLYRTSPKKFPDGNPKISNLSEKNVFTLL